MRAFVAVLLLAAVASATTLSQFRSWAKTHGKVYTAAEEPRRFAIFKENLAIIERLNLEDHGATFGANQFSDLTREEFKNMVHNPRLAHASNEVIEVVADSVTAEKDYRNQLPAVKNQASCGSCWAFSAIGNAEGVGFNYQDRKQVITLSEQELVSCDSEVNQGCNGGDMYIADQYIIANGIATGKDYPYTSGTGATGKCKKGIARADVKFSDYKHFGTVASDATLIKYVDSYGPLSIAIEADQAVFQSYVGGVLDSAYCGTTLDHGVLLVGYGTDSATGKNYWLVRNSWGASWGENGYIKMVRGKNMCGMNSDICTIVL